MRWLLFVTVGVILFIHYLYSLRQFGAAYNAFILHHQAVILVLGPGDFLRLFHSLVRFDVRERGREYQICNNNQNDGLNHFLPTF